MAVKFRGSGKIPGIPIHADTSPAYAEVDKFISDTGGLKQTVQFDANFTQAEGRLKRFLQTKNREMFLDVKINDKKIDEALKTGSKHVLLDAAFRINQDSLKDVLNDAKLLSQGISAAMSQGLTDEVERMRGTLKSLFDEYGDLKTIVDGKVVSGLRDILNSADDLSSLGNIAFNVESLQKAEELTAKIFENEKEITKELTKQEKSALWKKLNTFKGKINKNLSALSTSDMREVLDIIDKLKDAPDYARKIEDAFGNMTASFIGIGEVTGLQEIIEEFKNSASALRNVEWGFGKRHEKNQLIEDQKVIIDQLKQIGKLRYSTSFTRDGRIGQEKLDILGRFDDEELESRFTEDQLRTRIILLNQLRDNIDQYVKLTKSQKDYLFDGNIDQGENFYRGLLSEIAREQKYIDQLGQYKEEDYDVPSPEELYKKFKDHVDSTLDRKEMSRQLQKDFEFYTEAILNGRYSLEEAINSFTKDIEVDKMNTAWEEMIDGMDVPQRLLSMPKDYAAQIREGTLELNDAISYMRGAIDGLQTEIVPDDMDDLDELFESENLRHYNELIEECTQLTGELSDAVLKYSKIQREMIELSHSGDMIPQDLKDAKDQIAKVISGYFKKDFFEPTLSTDGILMWLDSAEAASMSIKELVEDTEKSYQRMLGLQVEHDARAAAVKEERDATIELLGIRKEIERISRNASKYQSKDNYVKTELEYYSSALNALNKQRQKLKDFAFIHDNESFESAINEIESIYSDAEKMMLSALSEGVSHYDDGINELGDVKSLKRISANQRGIIEERAKAIRDVNRQLSDDLEKIDIKDPFTQIPKFGPVYYKVFDQLQNGALGAKDAVGQLRAELNRLLPNQSAEAPVNQIVEDSTTQQIVPKPVEVTIAPDIEDGAIQAEISESVNDKPVEVPIVPVVEQDISTMVSSDIIDKITHGIDIEKMLADRGLQGEQLTKGVDLFKDFAGSLYLGDSSPESSQDLFTELFDFVVSNAKTVQHTEKILGDFRDYMKSRQIRIPENMESTFAAEFVDSWKELEKLYAIGGNSKNKKKLLTTSKYASTPDALVEELIEKGFGYAFDSKMMENFNGSPQDSLRMLLDAIQRAKDEFKLPKTQTIFGMDEEEQNDFVAQLSEAIGQVEKNIMELHTSIAKTSEDNDILAKSADRAASALERKAVSAEDAAAAMRELQDAEENVPKKPIKQDEDETIEPILQIAEASAKMIELISSAAGKNAATKFLEGITDETDLQKRVTDYFNEVFGGNDWKFKEGYGSYTLVGNTINAHLINSAKDTLDAVFKLNDGVLELQGNLTRFGKANIEPFNLEGATADASAAIEKLKLELGDIEHSGLSKLQESFKAIVDEKTFRAFNEQLKVSQKEVKKIADDTKWVIEQNKQLDTKVRSYKYGSKQLNGTTKLEDPDATSMEEGANKTIDGLADHIRTRLKNVAAGTLTDAMKNIIRDDMRVLENEIKVGQLEKYTSTTMSASEAEAARKSLINQLDTLKAQAEKSNVFDKISESYDKLRQRLTDKTSSDYIKNNFVDAVNETRVIRSELNKAVAESGLEKQRQQHLNNTLKIQERLYEAKKKYVELDANESTNSSDLQVAERKIDELQQQYDKSLAILKNAEDYNAIKQRELQLEQELYAVQDEADHAGIQRIEKAAAAEQLKIQKQQKANYEELISLQKKYNEADYNWHKADISGEDKSPYNEQMESYIERMRELRKETALTAEQQVELNKINNDHKVKKNKLLDAVAAADSKSLSELKTFSRWESDIKNVGMLSDETVQRIKDMRTAIDGISEGTDIKKLAEDFKELKSEVKYETTQSKATKTRMADIKASLEAQKKELKALYGELDLDLSLGDKAPNRQDIQDIYLNAMSAIERCTSAIGEQTQEEIASATASVNAAKIKMEAYKEMQDQFESARMAEEKKTGDGAIKQYYQTLNSTIKQIASLDTKINGLKLKDDGSGVFASVIDSLDMQRSQLLEKVRDTAYRINDVFSDGFVQGNNKVELPFSSILRSLGDNDISQAIQDFFNDFRVQEALTEQSIDKFVINLQNAQNKAEEFATVLVERLSVVSKSAKTLSDMGRTGAISTDNELYKGGLDRLFRFKQYQSTLPSDPTAWSAEQTITIQKMANDLNEYVSALDKATSKESEYFANKKQYANIANMQDYTEMSSSMYRMSDNATDARSKLESFVDSFADGHAIITGFTTSADGISKIDFSVLEEGTGRLRNFSAEMGQFTSNVYTFETSMNNMTAGTKAAQNALASMSQIMSRLNSYGLTSDNNEHVAQLFEKMQSLGAKFKELGTSKDVGDQSALKNAATDAERFVKILLALEKAYLNVNDAAADGDLTKLGTFDKNQDSAKQFAQSLQVLAETFNGTVINAGDFTGEINKIPVSIETADGEIKNFIVDVEKLGHTITASLKSTEKVKTGWQEFKGSLGGLGKEILKYGSTLVGVYDFVRYLKQGFNEVLEIDTAMTELKKVTNETDLAYSNFLKNAYTSSKKIGTTMKDFTQATADFARLGYTLNEASQLSEAANVYMNVGDGIEDVGAASESIISTMKAFNIEAEGSMGIVDRFNEVGNNFAIDSVGIGEALQRSASALAEAGNTIDESIALVTGANTVVQNPEQVGTALKTLALRLRGAKVELEEAGLETDNMAESTSTLQSKLQALTHGRVDIMEDADTFKSTTQILREMADAWEYMTDIERASALELMGGKRQANILSSLISNFDIVEDVIETSLNSENSAIEENAKYMDSMQGRIDQLNNSMQSMWVNAMDSGVIKFFISLADQFVQLTDKAGLLNAVIAVFLGKTAFSGKKFGIANLFTSVIEGATGATKGITLFGKALTVGSTGFKLFNAAATAGVSLLAGVVISGLIKVADELIVTSEEIKEAASQAGEAIKSISSEFKSNEKFVTSNVDRFAELAQGVDMLSGKNLSLSAEGYEEFLNLSNQLADVFPTLSRNYDENGNAIVQLSGNTDTMVSSLENLLEVQRQLANQKIAENLPDLYAGVKQTSDDYLQAINTAESKIESYQNVIDSLTNSDIADAINSLFSSGTLEYGVDKQSIAFADAVRNVLQNMGIESYISAVPDANGGLAGYALKLLYSYSPQQLNDAKAQIGAGIDAVKAEYNTKIDEFNADIIKSKNANKANWNSLSQALSAWALTEPEYKVLDDGMQSMVQTVINNLDYSSLKFPDWESAQNWIRDNIFGLFTNDNLKDEAAAQLSEMFNLQSALQGGKIDLGGYKDQINEFIDFVKNSGLAEETQKQLLNMFDIDPAKVLGDRPEETFGIGVDTMLNHAKSLVDTSKEAVEGELKRLGEGGTVDLTIRPKVLASTLRANGWDAQNGDIATVLSNTFSNKDNTVAMNFTPIIVDENGNYKGMLSPEELQTYAEGVIAGFRNDDLNLKIGATYYGEDAIEQAEHVAKTISELHGNYFLDNDDINFDELSYSDLQIMNSDQFNIDGSVIATMEQLRHEIALTKIALTQDFTTANFADYADSVSNISGSISTYQEALEKLESGSFTLTDFMDLISEFPELAEGVDVSSKSFDGLHDNLSRAIKNSPKQLVKSLKELKQGLIDAGKSTDHIDNLIEAIEDMPDDALKDTLGKYGSLIDVINSAKAAQNELNEAMGKNPNEGYETRGGAVDQMKKLMKQGMIGSESELWDIAKAYGFTYNSAQTITENADALHKFITARQGWYKTDKDGNYTYEGTENVINSIEKATKSDKFKAAMQEAFGEGVNIEDLFQWDYENGELSFDFDNENLDGIIQALAKTDELAGLTSEEFSDLLTQIGMFFNVNWQDTSDVSNSIKKIAEESGTADEKIQKMSDTVEAYVEKVTGKDIDMDSLTQASIDAMDCSESIKTLLKEYLALKDAVRLAEQNVDNANKKLKELGLIDVEFNVNSTDVEDVKTQIQKAQTVLDKFKNSDGSVNVDVPGAKEAQLILERLIKQKQELEKPAIMKVSVESYDDDTGTVIGQLQQFKEAYNNLEVQIAIGGDVDGAQGEVNSLLEQIKTANPEVLAKLNIDPTSLTPESLNTQIMALEPEVLAALTLDTTAVDAYEAPDKNATVVYGVDHSKVDNYKPETKYGEVVYEEGDGVVNGTANVSGTAHVNGTAYKSGSWGADKTETALVGELGPELLVRGNRWTTIGQNGAEFRQIKKGDIIFNHKQTEDLLSKGYVTGRGRAYASGTAYASGGGTHKKYRFYDTTGSGSDALSEAADKISDASEEFKEVFDWIAVRIEEITEVLDLQSAKLENAIGYYNKNNIIDDMIEVNEQLYKNLIAGAQEYDAFAQELLEKVPAKYREMAKNGAIAIETFAGDADEKELEAINEYREWVQKGAEVTQQAEETLTEISNLAKEAFDNIVADFDNKTSLGESKIDQLDAYNALAETSLGTESEKIYQAMIQEVNKNIAILREQRNAMQAELNEQVNAGNIKKYSDAWYEAVNAISEVDTEIIELTTDVYDYQDAINELHWDHFDNIMGRLEAISDESENLIDILGNKDLVDEAGNWTDEGITSLGLYAQQMENAEMQAKKYEEEIKYLNKNWKKLGYTEQEYIEKLEDLKSGQYDAIKAYNDTKDAIIDLNSTRVEAIKEGIQKEIDAYEELINKKKEELDAEKDLHDFQKGVADQQKEIADIERKLAALSADNSASARAKRAQLEAELLKAQADLEETYYDRSIEDQQNALDKELESFQKEKDEEMKSWDEYLENTEQVVSDSLATIQDNTAVVYQTLNEMGQEYSLSIADALTSPWQDGEKAIQSYSEKFGFAMSSTIEELRKVAKEYKTVMDEIEDYGKQVVGRADKNAQVYKNETSSASHPTDKFAENAGKEEAKTIKVGGNINAGSATIYDYIGDKTGSKQYYAADPIYKVLGIDGNWVQVRHKSLRSGISGWFKKSDIKAYAKGTVGTPKDQWALIDELGEELRLIPDGNGRLSYMKKGTGVVPADLTANLMEWGAIDPSDMLERSKPQIGMSPSVVNNTSEIHIDASVGELIHVEHLDGNNPAEISKIVDKAWDKRMKELNGFVRKYSR